MSSDSAGRRCGVITRSAHASRSGRALIHWGLTLALFIAPAACTPWKHVTSIAVTPKATTSCFGAAISFDAVVRARGKTWSTDGPRTVPRGAFLFVGPDGEPMATLVFPDDSRAVAGPLAYQVVPRQRPDLSAVLTVTPRFDCDYLVALRGFDAKKHGLGAGIWDVLAGRGADGERGGDGALVEASVRFSEWFPGTVSVELTTQRHLADDSWERLSSAYVYDPVRGSLTIDVTGGSGAPGGAGPDGADGKVGTATAEPTPGADGAAGGDGGRGGDGGTVIVYLQPGASIVLPSLSVIATGGTGGEPGAGGAGGTGGKGVDGTKEDAAAGAEGAPGQPGREGSDGPVLRVVDVGDEAGN